MAERGRRATPHAAEGATASQVARSHEGSTEARVVIFRLADGAFGLRLEDVGEILRPPRLTHMPLGPPSLLGLANLRGMVVPIISLRRLLGLPDAPPLGTARVIVAGTGVPVGFAVDLVENLLVLPADRIDRDPAGAGTVDPDLLDGVIKGAEGAGAIKLFNPRNLLRGELAWLGQSGRRTAKAHALPAASQSPASEARQTVSLLTFELGRQEYALPLDRVREVIPLPDHVAEIARSEAAVLGVVTLRQRLLPLVSLRALLGLPSHVHRQGHSKVVVLSLGRGSVGVVADRTREILTVDKHLIDPAPALLTRGAGDAEITSICRLDNGRRLVAVLTPDRLFRSDLVRRMLSEQDAMSQDADTLVNGNAAKDEPYVVFRLGDQEYALPVEAIDEVARPPKRITRLPKTPAFIDGLMNLRGEAVPIIDLRRRFELPARERGSGQRIVVVATGGGRTAFVVDNVVEVLKVPASAIRPAPELSEEQTRLIGRVASMDQRNGLILLIDPAQLLEQAETEVLARLQRRDLDQAS